MTTGEIAKKAGISQKTVRFYDEKGLLKPSEYSEGNYRLYDKESLQVLEKIIALKQVGFSLEEIRDNLMNAKDDTILETLQHQIDSMEAKRYELEKAITRIRAAIVRSNGKPDWDDVADIIRDMQTDQESDEGHFHALKHTTDTLDWYVKIYRSLMIKEREHILDLGCGFAKLWRNNWHDIPANVTIDGYDLPGGWADDFAKYIPEHTDELSSGTGISLHWGDLEQPQTWSEIMSKAPYTMAIAHYLMDMIDKKENFIAHVASCLTDGGLFSVNHISVSEEYRFWQKAFQASGLHSSFADTQYHEVQKAYDAFKGILEKYFCKISEVTLSAPFCYTSSDELAERALHFFPDAQDYLQANHARLAAYFDKIIASEGNIIIQTGSIFLHCYK